MDEPPSDGNERVADIFIISADETVAVPLKEHLGKKEYRVTVVTDDAQLIEIIPAQKPDLLICDTTTGEQEGYEVIRRIKADEHQRDIPVLVLTSASTMEDLLRVLESDADNFIAPPFDLPDNVSLMKGMLTTPVGQQTRDEIEKQFRVRYDDKAYEVAATRRKLLEFLLSSFDIVVRKSSGLSSVTIKLEAITHYATELEQMLAWQTQATETLHATVRQKEQSIIALTRESEERKELLEKKKNELRDLTSEVDALRQQVGKLQETLTSSTEALATERELRRVSEETTKAAVQRQEDLEKDTRRANEEMERVKNDQAAVISQLQEELQNAAFQIQSLESEVSTLSREKMHAEQEVRTLTAEPGQTSTTHAHENKSHPDIDEGHADAGKERHIVQQALFSDEKNTPKENPDLTLSAESPIPTPVQQGARPITKEITPVVQQHPVSKEAVIESEPSGEIPSLFSGEIPLLSGISNADSLFLVHEPIVKKVNTAPGPTQDPAPSDEKIVEAYSREEPSAMHDQLMLPASYADAKPEKETVEKPKSPRSEAGPGTQSDETAEESGGIAPGGDISFTRTQWLELLKWAHHSDTLSPHQRQRIVMMGRLIQKDGKLTKRQQEQIREIFSFVYALGYRS